MSDLFIDDGRTVTDHVPAVPGLHPAVEIVYRPALARERHVYMTKLGSQNPDVIEAYENDLIARHAISVNDVDMKDKDRARRLHPTIRTQLIDLILSYTAAREQAELGNSHTG